MNVSRQIGWSNESNLLYQILKQLNKLTSVLFGLKEAATPKYKVYTALLTQSGADDPNEFSSGAVTKGVTYMIASASDGDFANVGAPNNNENTFFVAINNDVPTSYGSCALDYDNGAPVATVLENTIGNIWFTYVAVGVYVINSNGLFIDNKTTVLMPNGYQNSPYYNIGVQYELNTGCRITTSEFLDPTLSPVDGVLTKTTLEIRVYN
jgi:hypothetical protein